MRRFILLAAMLFTPGLCWAQQTAISATVTDPAGRAYSFLTGSASIQCPGNQQPTFNGSPLPRTIPLTGGDGNGHFTQVLWDVNAIVPSGCSWRWAITWQDGITSFITGNIGGVTGPGPVDLSVAISAFAVLLPASAGSVGSVSGTAPIVATPNPITGIGSISCPTCFTTASQIPIGNVGSAGLSGTSPITIASTGAIGCATCTTSASALTLNQLVIGAGGQGTSALGTLGTTTTLLHGNAGGAPTFGQVNLAADVTGQLPIGRVGSAGLSGTSPISIAATGAISCSTCQASGTAVLKKGSNGGNYVSATGSFAAVDGTNLADTLTIATGTNLVVTANGVMSPTGGTSTWYVALFDGSSNLTEEALSWTAAAASNSCPGSMNCGDQNFSLSYVIVGDGASHTIQLRYAVEGASNDTSGRILNAGGIVPTMVFMLQ